jgi:transcription antitermination factor NusB
MAAERREHRVALEILYAVDIGNMSLEDVLVQARDEVGVFGRGDVAAAEDPYEPEYPAMDRRADAPRTTDWPMVERLVRGTLASKAQLESELTPHLRNWKIARLPGVDRLVLDLCAWELRNRPEVEATTVINHAVELVRRMSSEESVAYVNAVLDAFAKSPARGALESEANAPLLETNGA